ncbi:MAG: hypothetical protein ACFNP8_06855, partial [Alloprevotella sp.]
MIKTSLPAFSLQPVHGKASASPRPLKNLLTPPENLFSPLKNLRQKEVIYKPNLGLYNSRFGVC